MQYLNVIIKKIPRSVIKNNKIYWIIMSYIRIEYLSSKLMKKYFYKLVILNIL